MDLIVTSGGLGPTADDLTAEVVARFAGRELVLDEEMEEKIAAILRGFARRLRLDEEAMRDANRKQAMVPEGAIALDPVGTAPGLVVPAGRRVVVVLPGPAARAAADVAGGARDRRRCARCWRGRRRCAATRCGCSASRSRRSPRACARWRRRASRCRRGRDHHLPAARRDRDRRPLPRRRRRGRRRGGARRAWPSATERHLFSLDGETIDAQVATLLAGRTPRPGRVLQRRAAGGADHRPARGLRLHGRRASSPTRTRRRPSCSASIRR